MRYHAVFTLVICLICPASSGQVYETQTDWSGGPAVFGPVQQWNREFLSATETAWRPIPGQLALACTPLDQPIQHIIVGDADHSQHCGVGDVNGDGVVDVLTADPVTDVFNELGAVYWWQRHGDGSWTQHAVDEDFYGAEYVASADVDRDGDLDVIAAAYYGLEDVTPYGNRNGRYAWFENINGDGSAWTQHVVGELFWGAQWIDAGDLDGDGDVDVAGASSLTDGVYEQDGDITWFENLDGAGTQWAQHDLETERNSAQVRLADLDGDGDLDVVGAEDDRIAWWENRNSDGTLWIERYVSTELNGATYLDVGDLDDDGDLDVIGGAYGTPVVVWWENTAGSGTVWFPRYVVGGSQIFLFRLRDIDGDGDLDAVLSGGNQYGFIYWIENESGDGVVWNPRLITNDVEGYNWVALGDLNADGRLDAAVVDEGVYESTHQLSWYDLTSFDSQGELLSSVLDGDVDRTWGTITWDIAAPVGTSFTVQVRAADDPYALGPFIDVEAPGDDLADLIDPHAEYFQYRLALSSSDAGVSPIVSEIGVEQRLLGDLDGDGCVDLNDLAALLANYGCTTGCVADLDGDGDVDLSDLAVLLANYGGGCG